MNYHNMNDRKNNLYLFCANQGNNIDKDSEVQGDV